MWNVHEHIGDAARTRREHYAARPETDDRAIRVLLRLCRDAGFDRIKLQACHGHDSLVLRKRLFGNAIQAVWGQGRRQ